MADVRLFMVILGCRPSGRLIEQHDIFFGIAASMKELIPAFKKFWPEANGHMHVDAWREVKYVNGFEVKVANRNDTHQDANRTHQLYFINLGGYKPGEFEEYHYKMVVAATDKGEAVRLSKQTAFYQDTGFKGAESHIDDKYGVDVDDLHAIEDILSVDDKANYSIQLFPSDAALDDALNIGYYKLDKL